MNNKAVELARHLSYQNTAGIHTYGECSSKGCRKSARGSCHCGDCVEKQLVEFIGEDAAKELHDLYHERMVIQSQIESMIGEM